MNVFVIHEFMYHVVSIIPLPSNEQQLLSVESQDNSPRHALLNAHLILPILQPSFWSGK
jgi:hypothetical protein